MTNYFIILYTNISLKYINLVDEGMGKMFNYIFSESDLNQGKDSNTTISVIWH